MTALAWLLVVGCLAVVGLHLLRLVVVRADPQGEASHAAMGVGMAAMFSPVGDPVPSPVWIALFALCGAWAGAAALRTPAGPLRSEAVHHVVGGGAMVFMLSVGHGDAPAPASVAAIVLAGYFGWHVLRCSDRFGAAPAVVAAAVRSARVAAGAHAALAAAMAVMLLGMV